VLVIDGLIPLTSVVTDLSADGLQAAKVLRSLNIEMPRVLDEK
jgi:hypothetical protein